MQEIQEGKIGIRAAARKFGVTKNSIVKWRKRYELSEIKEHRI